MISTAVTSSFKADILAGIHKPGDSYKMALYTSEAELGSDTVNYTEAGEVSSLRYRPGGAKLDGFSVRTDGEEAVLSFNLPTWHGVTMTARGALIYNASRQNRSVAVFDFGSDMTATNGDFSVNIGDEKSGLIRIN